VRVPNDLMFSHKNVKGKWRAVANEIESKTRKYFDEFTEIEGNEE
jgi:hypothetical protein